MAPVGQTVKASVEGRLKAVMSGDAKGVGPGVLRAALCVVEPAYASAVILRNKLYDRGVRAARRLSRPVISIGNLTTGGTGKTPMVRWLAERLRDEGRQVAILSRGYGARSGGPGDELTMLDRLLNSTSAAKVWLRAGPDRFAAGKSLLDEHPEINAVLLDDGFQHRRLARDLDIVLISAAEPFGFGHVIPRGLLREPLSGLRRANAVVLTHADQVGGDALSAIEKQVRRQNATVPIYQALHRPIGVKSRDGAEHPMDELSRRRFFAFCGIANPQVFQRHLSQFATNFVGSHWFGDHHHYTFRDLKQIADAARGCGAELLVTTAKDWVKVEPMADSSDGLPIRPIDVRIQFRGDDEDRLLGQVRDVLAAQAARKKGCTVEGESVQPGGGGNEDL